MKIKLEIKNQFHVIKIKKPKQFCKHVMKKKKKKFIVDNSRNPKSISDQFAFHYKIVFDDNVKRSAVPSYDRLMMIIIQVL